MSEAEQVVPTGASLGHDEDVELDPELVRKNIELEQMDIGDDGKPDDGGSMVGIDDIPLSEEAPQTPFVEVETSGPESVPEETRTTPAAALTTPRTPKSGAVESPKSQRAFDFEEPAEAPLTPRTETPRTPKTPATPATAYAEIPVDEAPPESEPEAPKTPAEPAEFVDEERERIKMMERWARGDRPEEAPQTPKTPAPEEEAPGTPVEEPAKEAEEEAPRTPVRARRESPSPPPRAAREERAASPGRPQHERPPPREYVPYDQDSHKEIAPTRLPTAPSFSSWVPTEKMGYQPLAPLAVNYEYRYKNDYPGAPEYRPQRAYSQIFDDTVSTGAFGQNLYSMNRLVERSRSRTRERRNAYRSHRSATSYSRYTQLYPAPTRTREYATPRAASLSRAPAPAESFVSFMEYAGASQYDLQRSASQYLYGGNGLTRATSHVNLPYEGIGRRASMLDRYVANLHTPYEYNVPSTYEGTYRTSSRSHLTYIPYSTSYVKRAADVERTFWQGPYERAGARSTYTKVAPSLSHTLLRNSSYSNLLYSSAPRTSVYARYYPYR
ncbi:Protein T23E7.2 f [Aphelenchoides avenae]|nr:Protein T23E7.2 f [Aphelenchus avenae]